MDFWRTLKRWLRRPLEGLYAVRLAKSVQSLPKPKHVGVILDGNRRWAAEQGGPTSRGHRVGASRIAQFLDWCAADGIEVVTLWLLSTDNLTRAESELIPLLGIIESTAADLAAVHNYRLRHVGAIAALPERTRLALEQAVAATAGATGLTVNLAIGYGGRREVVDAVRAFMDEQAATGHNLQQASAELSVAAIESHLYTKGQPDPDLVIRTSGEQRLSGFLLWQSAHSEFWFCDAYWPDFRHIDFLRALRDYGTRQRRYGN